MAAPRSWTVYCRRRAGRTERLLECPRCGELVSITESQLAGEEAIWCTSVRCGWSDRADLTSFKE